jgi:BlaI family transcriptional regulator, penicillinase repressor
MKAAPRISEAEWEVMKVLWKKSPCSAHEISDALAARVRWSSATVKTFLNRLLGKGALRFEKSGKAYLYSPAHTEEEFRVAEAESFLCRVFDGALSPMLAHFVQSRHLTSKEWDSLEQILKERKKTL